VNDNPSFSAGARLKSLLKEAGLKSTRLDATRRLIIFPGRTRDWTFVANIFNGWLHVHTYVCEIPQTAGLRAELLDVAMTANQAMSLTKFSKGESIILELEYRDEHVDGAVLGSLLSRALTNAEEYYPRLFRTVSGDGVLAALSDAGRQSATA